jgi:hypothetical protein
MADVENEDNQAPKSAKTSSFKVALISAVLGLLGGVLGGGGGETFGVYVYRRSGKTRNQVCSEF